MIFAKIGHNQKQQEKAFEVRLKRSLKKASNRELEITALCVQEEFNRRYKK